MTLRRALDELEARRVVERRHGAGTFVRRPAVAQPLMATSFHEDMVRRGYRPSSTIVDDVIEQADADLAARLEIGEGDPVLVVRRLRSADDEPIALETLHVPAARAPGLSADDLVTGSFYVLLRERFGRRVARGRQTVAPVVPSDADAALLEIDSGTAAFRFVRVSRDHGGEVVELVDAIYRADRYLIEMDLVPPSDGLT